jgi:hypothetical protein
LRILFDKNVPVGIRRFLTGHQVRTFVQTGWPVQLEYGELLKAAENAGFDVLVTSDHSVPVKSSGRNRPWESDAIVEMPAAAEAPFLEVTLAKWCGVGCPRLPDERPAVILKVL